MKSLRFILMLLVLPAVSYADTQVDPDLALQMLQDQERQFEQGVIEVAPNVFTAVGYHGANTSMIVGDDGVIIVDTLMGPTAAGNALKALREYSDKPVVAIVYTHSHGDHTGGAAAFVGSKQPEVYAMANFGNAEGVDSSLGPISAIRGVRQFGRDLSGDEVTNRGVAPAGTIDFDRAQGHLPPTFLLSGDSYKTRIAGVEIEMHSVAGETDDALFVWLPEQKVLFSGDNFYQSFPNLYAIRGTGYRDVRNWSEGVAKMASFEPDRLVPGHTMPILEAVQATTALRDYSEAIASVFEQTVAGMNQGKSPNLIAHEVELPEHLQNKPYLIEFYGTVSNAVKAIYSGLLGWYDGNPTSLNPLAPRAEAEQMAKLAGGSEQLTQAMLDAYDAGEYQWALELADQVKWLENADLLLARQIKIQALRGLAEREYNAPNRNYYLSYAKELESGSLDEIWF